MANFPSDWYWIVGGDETRAFSSSSATYVAATDVAYAAFCASGVFATRIVSEVELAAVLTNYGLALGPLPVPIPEIVSRMQLRRQLLTMDRTDGETSAGKLRDQIDAGIAASGDLDLIEYWDETSDFHRHHEKVEAMIVVFHLTDAQADAAWIAAAQLS